MVGKGRDRKISLPAGRPGNLSLLILIAISILIFIPLVMFIVQLFRSNFAYQWLVAILATMAAWSFVLFSRVKAAQIIQLPRWQPETLFSASPELLADSTSWIYAISLITLCLAVLLTAVVRRPQVDWRSWAGMLILTGFGLLAVMAGNPLTLMLSWAAIDLLEAWILFSWIRRSEVRTRFLIALSTRVLGIGFLIWAEIVARAGGDVLSFTFVPSGASIYLLLAAGLRLGVLPMQTPFLQDHPDRRGLGTLLRFIPAAASLVLLARASGAQISFDIAPFLLVLAGLSGIYSAVSWLVASSELVGRPFWILGMASLAVAAAVRQQPAACIAWGVACILSGGALFLYSVRPKGLVPVFLVGGLALTAFPYTPTWSGLAVYSLGSSTAAPYFDSVINLVLLLTHLALVLGYIRHALRRIEVPSGLERWVWVFYPFGLAGLILLEYYLGWLVWMEWKEGPGVLWWVGGIVLVLSAAVWSLLRRSERFGTLLRFSKSKPTWGTTVWGRLLSLKWFYQLIWVIYHLFSRMIAWFTTILEGEGGILWALVFLFLLFSLSLQGGFSR